MNQTSLGNVDPKARKKMARQLLFVVASWQWRGPASESQNSVSEINANSSSWQFLPYRTNRVRWVEGGSKK